MQRKGCSRGGGVERSELKKNSVVCNGIALPFLETFT
jgi:hypothetical protein